MSLLKWRITRGTFNICFFQSYERMNVADALMSRSYKDGERVIEQGAQADGMYFVESGEVRITIMGGKDGGEKEVNLIQSGGYFGELALVTHKPRAANAYAVGDIKLACKLTGLGWKVPINIT